jgi:hypothetical protein
MDASAAPPHRDAGAQPDASVGCVPTTGCADGGPTSPPPPPPPPPGGGLLPRVVAYVNCLCGFGAGPNGGACLASPDPNVNQVKAWEDSGTSPITHYVISFLSFKGADIASDPGEIWANGGGSSTDLTLAPKLADALRSAQAHGKKVFLSIGCSCRSAERSARAAFSPGGAASAPRAPIA